MDAEEGARKQERPPRFGGRNGPANFCLPPPRGVITNADLVDAG